MRVLLVSEGESELGGALETLVKNLGLTEADITCDRVSRQSLHAVHGKGKGYFKRTVRWMLEAQKNGYDGLILVIDEDGKPERIQEIKEAQEHLTNKIAGLRGACGVAVRSFDAWMLTDEKALTEGLGRTVNCQSDPERNRDPKKAFDELANSDLPRGELYAAIAEKIDLELLEKRCPKGFAPFAGRIRNF